MELKQVIQWMLTNGYGVIINQQFVITSKINNELFNVTPTQLPIETNIPIATTTKLVSTKSSKTDTGNELKEVWNKFISDSKIPHRVTSPKGEQYTVRHYNIPAAKALFKIVNNPAVNYERLIKSVNHYYTTVSYRVLLSKYLLNGVWEDEYTNYKENLKANDGSTKWED